MAAPQEDAMLREVLLDARGRISPENRWTQGRYARDEDGRAVHPCSPSARSWCAIGTVHRSVDVMFRHMSRETQHAARTGAVYLLVQATTVIQPDHGPGVSHFNDTSEHDDVLHLFDQAIDMAK
jgi:hypothetical protein